MSDRIAELERTCEHQLRALEITRRELLEARSVHAIDSRALMDISDEVPMGHGTISERTIAELRRLRSELEAIAKSCGVPETMAHSHPTRRLSEEVAFYVEKLAAKATAKD